MDRPVQIDVALISKITGLPTFDAQPEEYLDNKAREKELANKLKHSSTRPGETKALSSKTLMTMQQGSQES
jgi:hypothetical protein